VIAEAFDTILTLGWAFAIWFVLLCLAAALALHAVLAIAWWIVRAMWRGLGGPSWARSRLPARRYARNTRDYEEAA
jgi:Flp pilus assembly protein TadB